MKCPGYATAPNHSGYTALPTVQCHQDPAPRRPELKLGPERAKPCGKPCGLKPRPKRTSPSLRQEEVPAQPEILVGLPYSLARAN